MFYCVLCRLSSCDHLGLEKSPSARERNGTATGSRYIGKIKKNPVQKISTPLCKPGLPLESGNKLDHYSFSLFNFLSFHWGRQHWKRAARRIRHNELVSADGRLVFSHGFFRFPVCSTGESLCISCQNCASATRPHCSLHTDLILQPEQDPLCCFSSLPCTLVHFTIKASPVVFLEFQYCICEWRWGRCLTSLLSATMISSTYLVVFWACLLCWRKNKDVAS